jgi:predicted Zn-dependent peptidase
MVKKVNFIYNSEGLFILQVHIPSGSIYEHHTKKNIKGISHFLEHMLFKHTKHYSGKEILESFTKIGGYYNASTDKDETIFYVRTLAENYELATNLIYDIVRKPVFEAKDLIQERKVTLEEMASSKDDLEDSIYENGNMCFLCPNNVYRSPVIGSKGHLESMKLDHLMNYFNQRFQDYLVVVNCDEKYKKDIKNLVYTKFGQAQRVSFNQLDIAKVSTCIIADTWKRIRIVVSDTYQFNTQLVFKGFKYSKQLENICLKFVKYCLTGAGLYSLLYYELREKRGLVYNVTLSNEAFRYIGLVKISFGTSNKDTVAIVKVVQEVIDDLKNNGLKRDKLKFFKESYVNNMKYKFIDQEKRTTWHGENLFYGCKISEKQYIDTIESITNEDIKTICQKVFDFKLMGFMTMGPYSEPKEIKNNMLLLMM